MNFSSQRILKTSGGALALLVPAVICLTGCVVEPVRVRAAVYAEPVRPLAVETLVIETPPPPPREEIIVAQPSPAHVWIRGYWAWRESAHVWIGGHWELPPRAGCVWVEPRWEHRDRGYVFIAGSWRNGPVVAVQERVAVAPVVDVRLNFVAQPPPPLRREVIVERERPSPEHVWIRGYWVWREGRHFWIAGHWEHPPRPGCVWIEPRWEHHPEGYVFIAGCWR